MKNIQFLKDTKKCDVGNILPDTFLVYHSMYEFPENLNGIEYLEFNEFKKRYFSLHSNKFIFVGLNKMITPSNRCDMVFEFMFNMSRNIEKFSIDTEPFIGEPWRLWYHLDITNQNKFSVPHSYSLETEWRHWFIRDINDCNLSAKNIERYLPEIHSDIKGYDTEFIFIDNNDQEWYDEAKDHVLSKYHTPKTILNEFVKICNKRYNIKIDFESYKSNSIIKVPNNKLYKFFVEENIRRQEIYNKVIKYDKNKLNKNINEIF